MSLEKSTEAPELFSLASTAPAGTDAVGSWFLVEWCAPGLDVIDDEIIVCRGRMIERRMMSGQMLVDEMGFAPSYVAILEEESGPCELGEWVSIRKINYLRVAK